MSNTIPLADRTALVTDASSGIGETLSFELRRTGVRVAVPSPGVTKSELLEVSGQGSPLYPRMTMNIGMSA